MSEPSPHDLPATSPRAASRARCPRCAKPEPLCVCDAVEPARTRTHVLFLQHPQEPGEELGSARIAHLSLSDSTLRVGLSWPNLRAALGPEGARAFGRELLPSRWAVLYLGSGVKGAPPAPPSPGAASLVFVDKKGAPQAEQSPALDGLVVLDGTWSQAKALWWRNAWLLKLRRAVLLPGGRSMYGELRREPRRECVSTLEAVADALEALGDEAAAARSLRAVFARLIERERLRRRGAERAAHPAGHDPGAQRARRD